MYFGCFFVRFIFTSNFCILSCMCFFFFSVESLALSIAKHHHTFVIRYYASLSDFSPHRSGISWFHVLKRIQLCDLLFIVRDTVAKVYTAATPALISVLTVLLKSHRITSHPSVSPFSDVVRLWSINSAIKSAR